MRSLENRRSYRYAFICKKKIAYYFSFILKILMSGSAFASGDEVTHVIILEHKRMFINKRPILESFCCLVYYGRVNSFVIPFYHYVAYYFYQ